MSRNHQHRPLWFDDPADFGRAGEVLAGAGYSDREVAEALDIDDARSLSGRDVSLLLRKTSGATPLDTLIRLFLIGVPVDLETAGRAVAPLTVPAWTEAGLLEADGRSVLAAVQLLPFRGLWLAFDLPRRIEAGLSPDYVMGVGASSLTLANLTVRRPSRLTLDLGTGCGFQAFLAAGHSERVLAVDCNPRAVHLAAFNARLNNLPNVDCLEGDLFEPVGGHAFDLVVSNPPFVISPETRYIYRDSGLHGDQITRTIVGRVPEYLRERGYCQILCNWAHVSGQDWPARLAGWFEGTGCDAWAMCTDTLDAAGYAAKWIRHTERDDADQFDRRFDEWTEYYQQERIEAVSGGVITMRRRSGGVNWFRADDGPEKMLGPAGDGVLRSFEAHDFLDTVPDDEPLMQQRLRVAPEVRLHQGFEPSPEGWSVIESELQLARGLAYSGNVDPYMARLIVRCNGRHRLGDLIGQLAGWLDKSPAEVTPTCLEVVRRLIERGFLLPPDQTG